MSPVTRQTPAGAGRGSSEIIHDDELGDHGTTEVLDREEALELTEQIRNVLEGLEQSAEIIGYDVVENIFRDAAGLPSVTATCACGVVLVGLRRDARYCSNACRQRAYRDRRP